MFQYAVHHAKTSPQYGNYSDLLALDLIDLHGAIPTINRDFFSFKVGSRFISQQTTHLLGQLTKTLGTDVCFTHQTQFVFNQRMFDFDHFHYSLLVRHA